MFDLFKSKRQKRREQRERIKEQIKSYGFIYEASIDPLPTQGYYPDKKPEGIIVHYTAGGNWSANQFFSYIASKKICTMYIDGQGNTYLQHDIERWGWHAGKSECPITGRKSVSKYYIGIEVANWGLLTRRGMSYYTHTNQKIPDNLVNIAPDGSAWHALNQNQVRALQQTCKKLMQLYDIPAEMVLGHSEVSPGRKHDIGMSYPKGMMGLRNSLK